MRELNNIRAEVVSIADRVERIPEMLLQIEFMRRDIQVALVLLRKMTANDRANRRHGSEGPHIAASRTAATQSSEWGFRPIRSEHGADLYIKSW
jgi:hypothetical protein